MSEKTIVITGASSGIGRATVRRFARPGVNIALIARGRDGLDAAAGGRGGGRTGARAARPTSPTPRRSSGGRASVEEALGPIDVWINDAMTTVFAFFEDVEPEEFERANEVTYFGSIWGMQAALKRMRPRDRGTIVQVGSAMAYRGIPLQAPVLRRQARRSKGVFESLRTELRHKGSKVHLTTVQLPGVNTPQFEHCRDKFDKRLEPVPPVYQPEVAADAIHWAAHHRRREVYVGIPTVYTIWGNKLAPWLAERYLARTAVSGQLTDANKSPERQDNLFTPPPGDPGAHGPYDDQAHAHSIQWWLSRHRRTLGAGALAGASAAAVALRR